MRVAVVGAGFSGLRTAMLLEKRGFSVQVFEARNRVGGRAHTIDLGEGYYEAGGEWLDSDHQRVLALLNELGFRAEPSDQWPGRVRYGVDECREDQLWPDLAEAEESLESEAAVVSKSFDDPLWVAEGLSFADTHTTLDKALDTFGKTDRAKWGLEARLRSDEGEDLSEVGLYGWIYGFRNYLEREGGEMSSARISGGAEQVCREMAARLRNPVHFNAELRSVDQRASDLELRFADGNAAHADRCILTLPPKPLNLVQFLPVLSIHKSLCIEKMGSARAIKVVLVFNREWWLDEGWKGRLLADQPFQQCWSGGQDGLAALGFYICGKQALDVLNQPDPVSFVLESFSKVEPIAKDHFVEGRVHDWINDPFSQGAFASLAPGAATMSVPYAAEPWGKVYFAGEWTSPWIGFYEGALESAERVAAQIG
ncbi:MAG: FAD-dependent oxidoreductase [Armatimonadota bacterium]